MWSVFGFRYENNPPFSIEEWRFSTRLFAQIDRIWYLPLYPMSNLFSEQPGNSAQEAATSWAFSLPSVPFADPSLTKG
jgi:hypothetical protein